MAESTARLARRDFCIAAAAGAVGLSVARYAHAATRLTVRITVHPGQILAHVPQDFMGLSYETRQLSFPEFFSSANTTLVQYFRTLSPCGVLRIGGSWSAHGRWSETGPAETTALVDPSDQQTKPQPFVITPESIRALRSFLEATGWRCIYGLNLEPET